MERVERAVKLVDVLNAVEPVLDAAAAQLHKVDGLLFGQSNVPEVWSVHDVLPAGIAACRVSDKSLAAGTPRFETSARARENGTVFLSKWNERR